MTNLVVGRFLERRFPVNALAIHMTLGWVDVVEVDSEDLAYRVVEFQDLDDQAEHPSYSSARVHVSELREPWPGELGGEHARVISLC